MPFDSASKESIRMRTTSRSLSIGLTAVVIFFLASGFSAYWNTRILSRDGDLVVQTHQVMSALDDSLSLLKDAETGQRGYIITGEEKYLEPYTAASQQIGTRIEDIRVLVQNNPSQLAHLDDLKPEIQLKLRELGQSIDIRRASGFDRARILVQTDQGKDLMDSIRLGIETMNREEASLRSTRLAEMSGAYRTAVLSGIISCILGVFLSFVFAFQIRRTNALNDRQKWLQSGQVGLNAAMSGKQSIEQLSESILKYLAEYLDAHAGTLFTMDSEWFQRRSTYGVTESNVLIDRFTSGDGLLGQAVKDKRTFLVHDVPEGYLSVTSGLGSSKPRNLILTPAIVETSVNAVIELGFMHPINELSVELLDRLRGPIGIAVQSSVDRVKLQILLEETRVQSETLQIQTEELRVSNEELEEQSSVLTESQVRLEEKQAELEQTIQFKSNFLANMSHELRTPLNSCLILAKLLSDNRNGNLTVEQVKYAETIHSSGNDLLALISDILDLSKIEAGHMEIRVHPVYLEEVVDRICRTFEPMAAAKSLEFQTRILPETPSIIETDPQRLDQVLKNLLSNAIKFTEKGEVALELGCSDKGFITFCVRDSGIGIAKANHEIVFEAFRQADGTTNRKYAGTGLGLSISRQLANLLGGEITMTSDPGKGSAFTLTIPQVLGSHSHQPLRLQAPSKPAPYASLSPKQISAPYSVIEDDRDNLAGNGKVVLVVEDDAKFARILYDLAHEHGFQCLIAMAGEAALSLAEQYLPCGVLLDIGLPDQSGLSVLDRLKHNNRTRHIPVHIVSGIDNARSALELGAVGYMLKPIKPEEISKAFQALEERLTTRMRRVLVVEDDAVQLDSLRLLIGSSDVETIGVRSAVDCLDQLRDSTFDCMVLDLSLSDASGFSLLETLSKDDAYSFPPVIVYTGRELSVDEELSLRRYSKSIIVKGAKSPERLLDEVTLFLHQVVADLPIEKQELIEQAKQRDAAIEDRLILIVEDDIRNIFALTSVLELRGAKVVIARNGREAVEVLDQMMRGDSPKIDLVLMDIMMPEMDGFTAMREIRKRPELRNLPIIALTAKAMKSDQEECLAAGADDYIAKPLDVEMLLSLVRVWMPR